MRESSAKELQTAFQGYEGASTPEEKKKWSTFIDSNIASQRKLGLNDYQIRAGVSQYAGGDMGAYDRVAGSRVDALVSKTNSDVMLSLLGGADVKTTKETEGLSSTEKMEYAKLQSPDERKKYLTDSKGYGSISKGEDTLTFNKDHSKLMGESVIDAASQINQGATFPVVENMTNAISQTMDTQQFDSAVNNFRQASTAQIDTISKQSEMANTTITTAAIDSDVNKTVAQQQPITIDTQQTDIGDRTIETTAAASNAAALEGLINKAPSIAPPINDESFMLAP